MSEKIYGTIVTDIGVAKIANAAINMTKVSIATVAVGDGGGVYYQPVPSMTELKDKKWSGAINEVTISEASPNMIDVVAIIPSSVGGFTIREMGIFDEVGAMIAICNVPDTEKVIITSGAAGEVRLIMHIEVSNTSQIKFEVDPTVILATKKDIEKHNQSPTAHENHTKNKELHVTKEWKDNTSSAIGELIEHSNNKIVHVTENKQVQWDAAYLLSLENKRRLDLLANRVENHETRVQRLEDGLFNNITGNPFLITFGNLEGVILTKGIWNKAQQRIEC